ncbi:L-threonine 3-dehydrogenase [Ciona intestinalis]
MSVSEEIARLVYVGASHEPQWFIQYCKDLPDVGPGEVLVKVRLATICASDLHTFAGVRNEPLPAVLGHEAVCDVIIDRRSNEENEFVFLPDRNTEHDGTEENDQSDSSIPLSPGSRVTFGVPLSCKQCERCRLGVTQKCKSLFKYGHCALNDGGGFSGCYATHMLLRAGTHIVPLPPQVTDKMAAPINCALATIVNVVENARTQSRNKVALVQGAGILGTYACAMLSRKGYQRVLCTDVNQSRLNAIRKFGGEPLYAQDVSKYTDFADCVIEVCGSPSVVEDGINMLRYGGTYVWAGMVHRDSMLSVTGESVIRKSITIKGIHNYEDRHLTEAVTFLRDTCHLFPYEELLSPMTFSLKDFGKAVHLAESRTFLRVGIQP